MSKTDVPLAGGYSRNVMLNQYQANAPIGNVFYVSSVVGTNATGYGRSPDAPFASLAYLLAAGVLTANNDDVVYIMPGHAESIAAAAGIAFVTAGVTVIGLGNGNSRPTFTFTTSALADIDIDAAEVTIRNCRFIANFLDVAAAIDVNADGFTIEDCEFIDTSVILNAKIWILGAAATASDRMVVRRCRFKAYGTANTSCISFPGTPDLCEVSDCVLQGDWGTAAILAAGICTNILIVRNLIRNIDAGDDTGINLVDTTTGIVAYNGVGIAETDNSVDSITCGTTVACIQNYSVDIGDRSGILEPAAT